MKRLGAGSACGGIFMTDKAISQLTEIFFARMRLPEEMRSDPGERDSMREHILSGERKLDLIAKGQRIDYLAESFARDLLYNYCFYARNDCSEKFSAAYRGDIITLRNMAVAGILKVEVTDDAEA